MAALTRRSLLYVVGREVAKGQASSQMRAWIRDSVLDPSLYSGEFNTEIYPLAQSAVRNGWLLPAEMDDLYHNLVEVWKETELRKGVSPDEYMSAVEFRFLDLMGLDALGPEGVEALRNHQEGQPEVTHTLRRIGPTYALAGPNSPSTSEEMLGMNPEALLQHLREWHPSQEDDLRLVSHEGQARALATAITEQPQLLAGRTTGLMTLRPTCVRAVLDGWGQAVRDGHAIPLGDVASLLDQVRGHSEELDQPAEGDDFDDDNSWLPAKLSAVRLSETLLTSQLELPSRLADTILATVEALADHEDPTIEFEGERLEEGVDPATLSLNCVRGPALHGAALWACAYSDSARAEEALGILEQHLPRSSQSVVDAAVLGRTALRLCRALPDWMAEHKEDLFADIGTNAAAQCVLTTLLELWGPDEEQLGWLRPILGQALDERAEGFVCAFAQSDGDGMSLFGDFLCRAYLSGAADWDDSVFIKWRARADAAHAARVVENAWRRLQGTSDPQPIERVRHLWDGPAAEGLIDPDAGMSILEFLISSGCVPVDWWATRLVDQLRLGGALNVCLDIDWLDGLGETNPELGVEILATALDAAQHVRAYWYREVGARMLKAANTANGGELSSAALEFANQMGRLGYTNLDEVLGF